MHKYVIDAGPLIHLDQINHLNILQKLPSIIIPASVIQEIKQDTAKSEIKTIEKWPNVQIISPKQQTPASMVTIFKKSPLQKGETDCIHLALEMIPCIFLTDDLNARRAAENIKLEVHGTVGLLAYALRQSWMTIEKAEDALNLLYYQSNLFITYTIIEEAIHTLRNSDNPT